MAIVLGDYRSKQGLWEELISLGKIQEYKKKTFIHMQGQSTATIYCLLSGKFKIIKVFPDGKERIVYIGFPPFTYGEYSYLSKWCNSPWNYPGSLIAEKNSVISAIPMEKAFFHFGERLDFIQMLIRIMFRKEASLSAYSAIGRSISFEQKLANILINIDQFVFSLNEEQKTNTIISQNDLAKLMCTSRPGITRQIKKFTLMGLVETSRYGVKVIDKVGLGKILLN
jgi:CRP-like cAMP-binding protein